jgi:membrane-associated protease RseP (regulator of RpoE activity)
MTIFFSVISFILVLVPLVILHEFGHFFSAKFFKIKVLEFGFGFPPKLFSIWSGEKTLNLTDSLQNDITDIDIKKTIFICINSTNITPEVIKISDTRKYLDVSNGEDVIEVKPTELSESSLKYKEMQWSFNLLPLGGFVKPFGEDNSGHPDSFYAKSAFKRFIVLVSGVVINAILPLFLFFFTYLIPGEVPASDLIISGVMPNSPADLAKLEPGDKIRQINKKDILEFGDLQKEITASLGKEIEIKLEKGVPKIFRESWEQNYEYAGEYKTAYLTPRWNPPELIITDEPNGNFEISLPEARIYNPASGIYTKLIINDTQKEFNYEVFSISSRDFNKLSLDFSLESDLVYDVSLSVINPNQISIQDARRINPGMGILNTIQEGSIGVTILAENSRRISQKNGILSSASLSLEKFSQLIKLSFNSIKSLMFGSTNPQFSGPAAVGPIGISQITGAVAQADIGLRDKMMIYVELISILSLSLAVINLLPIPALDGGRILFVLIEIIRKGKKVSPQKENFVHALGFMFMIFLLVLISAQDIIRIYQGTGVSG